MPKSKHVTIDIEPTWMAILHLVSAQALPESELYPVVQLADFVRQAQKEGKKQVIITLHKDSIDFESK